MGDQMSIKDIASKSYYQNFDFLGAGRGSSNSGKKWELSKLESYDITNKSVLDIGCNAGYFLFRLLNKDPKKLIGIDLGDNFIEIANELNTEYFKSDKVEFIFGDIFEYKLNEKSDLIICFSTFHYFIDKQKAFIDLCYNLLNDKGVFLLEVEENPKNETPEVDKTPSPADRTSYDYPNNLMMLEFCRNKFNITERYISTFQGGALYDRYFYRLEKI